MIIKKIKILIQRFCMFLFNKIFGVDNDKIVFESYNGAQYSDNPRAISEKMHEINPNLKYTWLLKNNDDTFGIIPSYVNKVVFSKFGRLKEIATAKVYISNNGAYPNLYKSKKQLFIETWHGDRGIKKILYDADPNRKIKVYNNEVTDICLSGSKFGYETYRTAFRYNGEIFNYGSPRNDNLVNENILEKQKIMKRLNIENKKVLLYAPTFRDNSNTTQKIGLNLEKVRKELCNITNEKWVILVRTHHVSKGFDEIDGDDIVNISNYPDMSDLLMISDMLITDYSSSATDFSITGKPIILYIPDYDEYKNCCRDFKADPKKIGLYYANNEEELLNIIRKNTLEDYKLASQKTNEYYKTNETGEASYKICERILKFINK